MSKKRGEWDDGNVENLFREFETIRRVDASLISPSYSRRSSMGASTSQTGSHSAQVLEEPKEDVDVTQESLHDIDMEEMIEAFYEVSDGDEEDCDTHTEDPIIKGLRSLASTPLFEGSRASILQTCLALLNLQSIYGWSYASVSALFKLLKTTIFPVRNKMPKSRDIAKKMLAYVGMEYNSIHACPNDCILFRGDFVNLDVCPKCGESRYRQDLTGTTIPAKVLKHFPIISQISHMFKCPQISKLMTWQNTSRSSDGVLRTPVGSSTW